MPTSLRRVAGALRVRAAAALLAALTLAAAGSPVAAGMESDPSPSSSPGWGSRSVAQALDEAPRMLPGRLRAGLRDLPPTASVAFHPGTGGVRFLAGTRRRPLATAAQLRALERRAGVSSPGDPDAAARAYLASVGELFGVARAGDLRTIRVQRSADGRTSVRYQQARGGVPVLGGELIVQLDRRGGLTSVSGEVLPADDAVDLTARVTSGRARAVAADWLARDQAVDASAVATASEGLGILDPRLLGSGGPPIPRLVWRIDARLTETSGPRRATDKVGPHQLLLVDARTGDILEHLSRDASALERRICDFENRRTKDFRCTRGRITRAEGDSPTGRQQVDAMYRLLAQVYDFWRDRFDRDGIDGDGQAFVATVRYCLPTWCPMQNAFWEWGPQQAAFGTGWADVDDLVGHEFTHGVLDHEARLFYDHQSGALNESFADIFGEGFDLLDDWGDDRSSVRWSIGEDLPVGTVRDMQDPGRFGDPDRVRSPRWYASSSDSGGVHSNSGVGNKAASLIADGGRFNGRSIRGIGLLPMLRIEYEAMTRRLTSASDYLDLHEALVQACLDLVGDHGLSLGDCRSVRDAVDATEMDRLPIAGGPRQAAVCGAGRYPVDAFADDLEQPSDGSWASRVLKGRRDPWHYPPNPSGDPDWDGTWASSGRYNLFGDDLARVTDAAMEMTRPVTVPPGGLLRFEHGYRFDTDSLYRDGGVVEISVDGGRWRDLGSRFIDAGYTGTIGRGRGNPLKGRRAFVGVSRGWGASRVDVSDFAGHAVRIRFRVGSDDRHGSYGWYLDDIRIYRCAWDTRAPTGSVRIGDGSALVKQRSQTLTITGHDTVTGVTRMRVSNSRERRGGLLVDGVEMPFQEGLDWLLTDTAWGGVRRDGVKRVWVQLRDRAGNWSKPFSDRTLLDSGPPDVSIPQPRLVAGTSIAADEPRVPVRVAFTAADLGTGVMHTQLQRRRDDGDWTDLDMGSATGTSVSLRLPDDGSVRWRFRARADDDAGFTSDWAASVGRTVSATQEGAGGWTWSAGWATRSDGDAFGGALREASAAGASGSIEVSGRQVALVAPRGPDRGIARIVIDGTQVAAVDLYAPSVDDRVVVWAATLADGQHTLGVEVSGQKASASTGTSVGVDAIVTIS